MLSIPGSCSHILPLPSPVQAQGTPVGLQELCSCLGRPLSAEPPLTKPHGQGKPPTAAPVMEQVSNKPGSSRVMLCANSSEALSRILLCWLCFFPLTLPQQRCCHLASRKRGCSPGSCSMEQIPAVPKGRE